VHAAGVSRGCCRRLAVHCAVLCCTALNCTALHRTALYCSVLYRTVLHCTALHCAALHCFPVLHGTALALHYVGCTALHCTALYCMSRDTASQRGKAHARYAAATCVCVCMARVLCVFGAVQMLTRRASCLQRAMPRSPTSVASCCLSTPPSDGRCSDC
jgi:hypothetical protein